MAIGSVSALLAAVHSNPAILAISGNIIGTLWGKLVEETGIMPSRSDQEAIIALAVSASEASVTNASADLQAAIANAQAGNP